MTRILIVDEDDGLVRLLREMLETPRSTITWCSDGLSATDMARNITPDLILLDLNVPGRDGFEVCRIIRDTEPPDHRALIAVITGRNDTASKLLAFSVGADDYLVKPIDALELRSRVDRWLDRRATHEGLIVRHRREAIEEIVATICHSVNNPLAVALMAVELALGRGKLLGETVGDLETARDHLLRIGDVLLTLQAVEDRTVPYVGADLMIDIGSKEPHR
jgi:DNA-binding response OmpR family regulator